MEWDVSSFTKEIFLIEHHRYMCVEDNPHFWVSKLIRIFSKESNSKASLRFIFLLIILQNFLESQIRLTKSVLLISTKMIRPKSRLYVTFDQKLFTLHTHSFQIERAFIGNKNCQNFCHLVNVKCKSHFSFIKDFSLFLFL
jgi:hypothetical protein